MSDYYVLQLVLIKFKIMTSPIHDSVIICKNQYVELTLQHVLVTTYIYISLEKFTLEDYIRTSLSTYLYH